MTTTATSIAFHPAVIEYITTSIDDAQTGDDTSREPWEAVCALKDPFIVDALREWYDETGGEEEDPRYAIAFVLDSIKRYERHEAEVATMDYRANQRFIYANND